MIRTRVGYAGGDKKNPTYHNLGDHTETIQIDFDPAKITYADLLKIFWESHNPARAAWSRQYMSIIFYHSPEQKKLALESKQAWEKRWGKIYTEIMPAGDFYLAEDYHQKYLLRQEPSLLAELKAVYPSVQGLVDSTAAARINGYLGGFGDPANLPAVAEKLGLSPEGGRRLASLAGSKRR